MAKPKTLAEVKKGDQVRLLVPHFDGFKRIPEDTLVAWWNDTPPDPMNAALPEDSEPTALTAPAMTDGKPPADYIDPETGKKPVIAKV